MSVSSVGLCDVTDFKKQSVHLKELLIKSELCFVLWRMNIYQRYAGTVESKPFHGEIGIYSIVWPVTYDEREEGDAERCGSR